MAKTWKTHPWTVRMAAAPGVLAHERHYHANGVCELARPMAPRGRWWSDDGRCRWEPSTLLELGPHGGHSCRWCARQNRHWRHLANGTERAKVRMAVRQLVKGLPPEEFEELL